MRVGHVELEGDRIAALGDPGDVLVVPGYVDLQLNGAFGIDLAREPERLWELAALLPRAGVTSFLPTIVTSPVSTPARRLRATASATSQATSCAVVGK